MSRPPSTPRFLVRRPGTGTGTGTPASTTRRFGPPGSTPRPTLGVEDVDADGDVRPSAQRRRRQQRKGSEDSIEGGSQQQRQRQRQRQRKGSEDSIDDDSQRSPGFEEWVEGPGESGEGEEDEADEIDERAGFEAWVGEGRARDGLEDRRRRLRDDLGLYKHRRLDDELESEDEDVDGRRRDELESDISEGQRQQQQQRAEDDLESEDSEHHQQQQHRQTQHRRPDDDLESDDIESQDLTRPPEDELESERSYHHHHEHQRREDDLSDTSDHDQPNDLASDMDHSPSPIPSPAPRRQRHDDLESDDEPHETDDHEPKRRKLSITPLSSPASDAPSSPAHSDLDMDMDLDLDAKATPQHQPTFRAAPRFKLETDDTASDAPPQPGRSRTRRRAQQGYVAGGMAQELQGWLSDVKVHGAEGALQTLRVTAQSVSASPGVCCLAIVRGEDDREYRVVLAGDGDGPAPGGVVDLGLPRWHAPIGGETWLVVCRWELA